jgi:hypothetical protein
LLIDRRNRLQGELGRLEALKRDSAVLHKHVKQALEEIDDHLDKHPIDLDWSVLESKVSYAKSPFDYGVLTAQILRALRDAPESGMTSAQIAEAIDSAWPASLRRPTDRSDFMYRLRKRLKTLRTAGSLSPFPPR